MAKTVKSAKLFLLLFLSLSLSLFPVVLSLLILRAVFLRFLSLVSFRCSLFQTTSICSSGPRSPPPSLSQGAFFCMRQATHNSPQDVTRPGVRHASHRSLSPSFALYCLPVFRFFFDISISPSIYQDRCETVFCILLSPDCRN